MKTATKLKSLTTALYPSAAGRLLQLSPQRVKQLADAGILKAVRLENGTRLLDRRSVMAFLQHREARRRRRHAQREDTPQASLAVNDPIAAPDR
jgi:hypothetical protein